MLEFRGHPGSTGYGELSRYNMLAGVAHVSCGSHIIFHIDFRIYFIDRGFDYIRAKNDNKPPDSKAELNWISDFYCEQDAMSVCIFLYSVWGYLDLLHDVIFGIWMAVDVV